MTSLDTYTLTVSNWHARRGHGALDIVKGWLGHMVDWGRGRATEGRERETRQRAAVLRSDALRIRHLVVRGLLNEADAYEVQETLELLVERVQSGAITEHFARLVIRKLADDKLAAFVYRTVEV